jgi:RNA polymerase sigma factor for flagellar operon FliA
MSTALACRPAPATPPAPRHLALVPDPGPDAGPDRGFAGVAGPALGGLWDIYKTTGDRGVRAQLIAGYQPLVRAVAARLSAGLPRMVDEADLVGYGTFGLIDAIERFDPGLGHAFEGYAMARIRGAIIDELRGLDWVPRSVRRKARELDRAAARLEARFGRQPTDRELAAEAGFGVAVVERVSAQVALGGVVALDARLARRGREEGLTVGDTVADRAAGPGEVVEADETRRVLAEAINRLDDREKLVVCLVYYEGLTLARIAEALGVSESRVCQIHTKAVARLRTLVQRAEREGGPGPRRPEPLAA